jgi:16S rRNA A1518/A1519 N6-dimethyltransferase RsmA/KsgA/DIM1 with predicted DNA glycosylase/AP lyase activity
VECAQVRETDTVLEIGTGSGFLTRLLAPLAAKVVSYEVDADFVNESRKNLLSFKNVELIHGDPFKNASVSNFDVCVSSLPYSKSRIFVDWISMKCREFRSCCVLVQDDFAIKLVARPGERNYRATSVAAQIAFGIDILERVPPEAFDPPPKVFSRIVRLTPRHDNSDFKFNKLNQTNLRALFSQRRKLLRTALNTLGNRFKTKDTTISNLLTRRVEDLAPEDFQLLLTTMENQDRIS